MSYNPRGHKELDTTERLTHTCGGKRRINDDTEISSGATGSQAIHLGGESRIIRLLQDIEYNPLCYIIGPRCLSFSRRNLSSFNINEKDSPGEGELEPGEGGNVPF